MPSRASWRTFIRAINLRARGNKNADGTEFAADEIVTGTFRNIAGTVTAVNAADNSLTVMDLLTKKPVMVKVAPDSQLRKLPQMMAQRIAMRLKGQTPEGQLRSRWRTGQRSSASLRAARPGPSGGAGATEVAQRRRRRRSCNRC